MFPRIDIITIGEAMVEMSTNQPLDVATNFTRNFAGDAMNTAIAASRLGSKTGFITRLGSDIFADNLRALLKKEQVNTSMCPQVIGQTGLYLVNRGSDPCHDQKRVQYYRKNSVAQELCARDINPMYIKSAKIVYSTGVTLALSEATKDAVHRAFEIAKENNIVTAFDPNYRKTLWKNEGEALDAINALLPLVDIILPSAPNDTQEMIGFSKPADITNYFMMKGVDLVVCKASNDGSYVGYQGEVKHAPAMKVQAVDTLGAGDAFNGGFLHALTLGKSPIEAAKVGNITAGLRCMNHGTINALPQQEAVYSRAFSAIGSGG